MEKEYMPIDGMELTQLQFMHSLYRCLKDDDSLKPRLSSIGLWWRYKGMLKQLHNMFGRTWETIEPEKRQRINYLWDRQELRIVNSSAPIDPTGDLVMIPKEAVRLMGSHCQRESCAMCMGTNNDRKGCLFRRGMVKMALPDLRRLEKQSGKCMGKLFTWEY